MINYGCPVSTSNAVSMVPYIIFDVFAARDTEHWTPAASVFMWLEVVIFLTSVILVFDGRLKSCWNQGCLIIFPPTEEQKVENKHLFEKRSGNPNGLPDKID
jgi:hypothetical protein